ncbi:hypothetical protein EYF80_064634 [Liparis tanakae]|uniref:Uncharacterized protein n=1 Tax=Liparis tanakae TaxID=230148 RepID=A0A4Z2E8U9_9TELE|nr:hypothetical protein EYF80_064634 [Liparis tanakae]
MDGGGFVSLFTVQPDWEAAALTSKCPRSPGERLQPVAARDAAPLAEIRRAGIEELRSMSHYGECRAPGNGERSARAGMLTVVA